MFIFAEIIKIKMSGMDLLFFKISTFLLCAHILYGGYYLFKKERRINLPVLFFCAIIGLCLVFLIINTPKPFLWIISLQAVFFFAMPLHLFYKKYLSDVYLQEFCNYKIYIEIYSIMLGFLGLLMLGFFPSQTILLSIITLCLILRLNFFIFCKKKLYKMHYPNISISPNPFISIIIPALNEEKYIGKLLESIKKQDYKNFEVIIVDDHSEDKTIEVAKGFESQLPLKIVQKEVRGISKSRNYGASLAKGEIILFLDADVVLPDNNFINKNLELFVRQKLSIAVADFIFSTEKIADKFITAFYKNWLRIVQYYNPRGPGFCLFALKELHNKVLFDESIIMAEDFDYIKRASNFGKFRILDSQPLLISWRRFKKENRLILVFKYLFFEWYRQNIGEIHKKLLPYRFGRF